MSEGEMRLVEPCKATRVIVEVVENGFLVCEFDSRMGSMAGPMYVFVTKQALAEWMVSQWKPLIKRVEQK